MLDALARERRSVTASARHRALHNALTMDEDTAPSLHKSPSLTSLKSGSSSTALAPGSAWLSWDILPSEWDILCLSTALKFLLFLA